MHSLSVEPSLASREQAAQYHTQLQLATNLANIRLQAAYKRLSIEGPEDPTQRLESALVKARAQVSAYATEPSTVTAVIVAALQVFRASRQRTLLSRIYFIFSLKFL